MRIPSTRASHSDQMGKYSVIGGRKIHWKSERTSGALGLAAIKVWIGAGKDWRSSGGWKKAQVSWNQSENQPVLIKIWTCHHLRRGRKIPRILWKTNSRNVQDTFITDIEKKEHLWRRYTSMHLSQLPMSKVRLCWDLFCTDELQAGLILRRWNFNVLGWKSET